MLHLRTFFVASKHHPLLERGVQQGDPVGPVLLVRATPCHPLGALFDLLMTLPVKRVQRITAHVSHLVVWCPARPVRVLFLPPHEIAVHSKCSPAVLVRGAA